MLSPILDEFPQREIKKIFGFFRSSELIPPRVNSTDFSLQIPKGKRRIASGSSSVLQKFNLNLICEIRLQQSPALALFN